jgi:hypothetical protein
MRMMGRPSTPRARLVCGLRRLAAWIEGSSWTNKCLFLKARYTFVAVTPTLLPVEGTSGVVIELSPSEDVSRIADQVLRSWFEADGHPPHDDELDGP